MPCPLRLIFCPNCKRGPIPHVAKGLCKTCYGRQLKGIPMDLPFTNNISKDNHGSNKNVPAEFQRIVERKVAIYEIRASFGLPLFDPPV